MKTPAWVRALVRALPPEFRTEFGSAIETLVTDRLARGRVSAWAEGWDLVRTVAREWVHWVGSKVRFMGKGREGMSTWMQDLRYAFRMLAKTPVVTAVAALSLGMGVAATASALALYDGFLLSRVPWDAEGDMLRITGENPELGAFQSGLSPAQWTAFEPTLEERLEAATFMETRVTNVTEAGLEPLQVEMVDVGGDFHGVVGASAVLGRSLGPEDMRPDAPGAVLLMHDYWARRYGRDRRVVGRTVEIGGEPHSVVGVLPAEFEMIPATVELIRASSLIGREDPHRQSLYVVGAPRSDVSKERLQAELEPLQAAVAEMDPEAYEGWQVRALSMQESMMSPSDALLVKILLGVAFLGLLIACANVANLLLGRAEERQREVSVRSALGAGRGRIVAQLLTESTLLALIGGAIGIAGAVFVIDWFAFGMPAQMPTSMLPHLSPFVLIVALVVTLGAGVAFGLAPALHAVRTDLRSVLTSARGGTSGRASRRLRGAFVVAEFAVAVALLTGASMLVLTLGSITSGDSGFRSEGVTVFRLQPLEDRYPEFADLDRLRDAILERLAARPEIAAATAASILPRAESAPRTRVVASGEDLPEELRPDAIWAAATGDFTGTFEVPLREGRWFSPADRRDGELVAVISKAFADRHFPAGDAVGRSIELGIDQDGEGSIQTRRVVGVVEDVPLQRLEMAAKPSASVFIPHAQIGLRSSRFAVQARGDGAGVTRAIREAVAEVDPGLPVGDLKTMERHVDEQLAGPRLIAGFVGGVGTVALILAALGIYGVLSHSVVRRTREIGIRMAMGAARGRVVTSVARTGLGLVGLGMLAGAPLAWAMTRIVLSATGEIFEVIPVWSIALSVTLPLLGAALLACVVPALRASSVHPSRALVQD